jgi:uncharacterized RDD family membrane protein YckC
MQCSACRAVYSNALDACPRCQTPVAPISLQIDTFDDLLQSSGIQSEFEAIESPVSTPKAASTLIEFPGPGRAPKPKWRKDLSERVREIQERRAREAAMESEVIHATFLEPAEDSLGGIQLGLVPKRDQPAVNPIVVAALKRLERAYDPSPSRGRASRGNAAVAIAHVAEEQFQDDEKLAEQIAPLAETEPVASPREHTLTVVQPKPVELESPATEIVPTKKPIVRSTPQPVFGSVSDDALPFQEFYDDRAPAAARLVAGFVDLLVVVFASSPFAAVIELTNLNWANERVLVSMGAIILLVMFLYLTSSTALAGRTWGMSLLSLRAVDVDTGLLPTTRQSVARAIAYMLSLATAGLGILYSLIDAEGRTVHDHISGTAVVRD